MAENKGSVPEVSPRLNRLFGNPHVSVAQARKIPGVSNLDARPAMAALEKAALLREITGRAWRMLYPARPVWL